jgi:hypothetical protein
MCQDFGFQAEFADGFEVTAGLLRGGRGGEFNVLDAKVRECFGNLYFFLRVKEGVGELFTLSLLRGLVDAKMRGGDGWAYQGGLDDGKI